MPLDFLKARKVKFKGLTDKERIECFESFSDKLRGGGLVLCIEYDKEERLEAF